MNKLRSSKLTDSINSSASLSSCLSTIATTRSTTQPASRNLVAALIADPPVVITSSRTVTLVPSGGKRPSIHA